MKYTPERVEKIINLIKAGNYKVTAALASGITEKTFYEWVNKHSEFSEAVKKASSEAEARNVMIIQKAAETTWQAAAWWLERTNYQKWGKKGFDVKISHKIEQSEREKINKVFESMSDEDLDHVIEQSGINELH